MLTTPFHPKAIMARPETLQRLCNQYYDGLQGPLDAEGISSYEEPPTPAGLALHLGFANVTTMIAAAEDPSHPLETRHYLNAALTTLEDHLTRSGLTEKTHPAFTKYIMSARLKVVEPRPQDAEDKPTININILGVGPQQVNLSADSHGSNRVPTKDLI